METPDSDTLLPPLKKSFLLYNKKYENARLAMTDPKNPHLLTHDGNIFPDQYWTIEESDKYPGNFYINNAKF